MESLHRGETADLCEGCTSLKLNTLLLSRINGESLPPTKQNFKLSPAHCSLCSLILRCLQRRELVSLLHFEKNSGNGLEIDAFETAVEQSGTEGRNIVRRFEIQTSSTPKIKIARLWPCVYPIPKVDQVREGNGILDVAFPSGRMIDAFAKLELFKRWRRLCSEHHGHTCALPPWVNSNDKVPPSFRVIDVRANCVVDAPIHAPYFALSYVWGRLAENDLCATMENINAIKKKNSLIQNLLPQTILDVMKLVLELGGQYLWVDRLCILQDDDDDKAQQIPCMDSIYSLAELTIIAASGSDAHDGVAGLSVPRSSEQDTCRIGDSLALTTIPTENTFSNCTYSQRGWTFQERLLARRSLMFTKDQTYWSCSSADWCERFMLEPSSSDSGSSPWKIPRIHLGSYETVPGEYYRDFSRQHYTNLPHIYALKDFTNSSDIQDAISGILRRCSLVTGDSFYWGHILIPGIFEDSLSWRKTRLQLEKRTALCPIRGRGAKYDVPFPSWSWLTWKTALKFMLDLRLNLLPNACLMPEIQFFHLDVEGKTKRLLPLVTEDDCGTIDRSSLLGDSGSWKGKVEVVEDAPSTETKTFRDSGRLLFWTSHAELSIQAEDRVRLGCVRLKIMSPVGGEVLGYISEVTLASDHNAAWPFVKFDEKILQSFIVISRKHKLEKSGDSHILVAKPILKVMWIQWTDSMRTTAKRISVGEVDERAWINLERHWKCVILQ